VLPCLCRGPASSTSASSPAGLGTTRYTPERASHDRFWQAEYWISGLRDMVLALACSRLGYRASYGKGAHLLPAELTEPLQAALVASLDPAELRRALAAAATALGEELNRADPQVASRLLPLLREPAGEPS
jgi:hypothetical protein